MKNKYILYFSLIVIILIAIFLYFYDIPAPSIKVTDDYKLNVE